MAFITEPTVRLVSRTEVNWEAVSAFLEQEGVPPVPESIRAGNDESAAVVEISARVCYMSYGKGRRDIEEFITNLLSKGDGSVFEHVNYGFMMTGVSRALTHELVRHRAGFAYSQRSQRFVDESDSPFVVPPAISEGGSEGTQATLQEALEKAAQSYRELVDALEESIPEQIEVEGVAEDVFATPWDRRKAIRQAARAVLPNATETKIFVTANVRAWRHFIEMRGASYADWEIRRLALAILEILREESPLLFGDFTVEKLPDGTSIATPKYSKV
jgi:thymidylate synthase (FAD)